MDIFITLILVSGVYAANSSKHVFCIGLLVAFPSLIAHWLNYFIETSWLFMTSKILGGFFYVFIILVILNYIFKEKQITGDVIAGAICAYFLIGILWSSVFTVLEFLEPGSFNIPENLYEESTSFTYYSYVTLTTLGYGDITPISAQARSFSLLEAITGQLYLAILIARLVAINIFQSMEKDSH